MNQLVQILIEDIKPKIIAIYGGGFKPPTKGHFGVVEQTLKDYPEIDELIIYVGAGVRDGITQSQSLKIWDIYSKYLPSKVKIEPVTAPVKSVMDYSKDHPNDKVYWVLGAREEQEEDLQDIAKRTKSIDKYPNLEVKIITLGNKISGTKTRKALMDGDKESFYNLIPNIKEREQVWDILHQTLNEDCGCQSSSIPKVWNLQDGILYLTKYMLENGLNISPLPKLNVISDDRENADKLLGYTAYYDPAAKCITLYTLNRHPKDILRSYAHEMIHHMQNLENRLNGVNTTNTNEDGTLPDIEREAYEKGNMMLRNWEDSIKSSVNEIYFLDIPKFNQPKTFVDNLHESLYEITLSKDNAVKINGDLTGGEFQVGNKIYVYSIKNIPNPYKDLGAFYNIQFTPQEKIVSKPTKDTNPKDYIKILSTMYKIIVDFAEKEKPEYIGIASMDNVGDKNYHTIYANLTNNKFNRIPGYFRKDVSLEFNTPNGKGRFVVLKRKD